MKAIITTSISKKMWTEMQYKSVKELKNVDDMMIVEDHKYNYTVACVREVSDKYIELVGIENVKLLED